MKKHLRPIRDRVLVRRVDAEAKLPSGLVIPEMAKEKPTIGWVVAVGHGRRNQHGVHIAPEVQTGDRVLIGKHSGSEIEVGDMKFTVLREAEILAIL